MLAGSTPVDTDTLCVNTLRFLAVDMVEAAKSGHPGLPLGAAPMAYVLWDRFLRHDPAHPDWPDRDRFVLSAGHGSALLYALLHMTGYDLPLTELQRFRQWASRTPGHPEVHETPGVEVTTGPLGQGFAMAVGLAAAERFLSARYNRDGFRVVDHRTYVLASDGDFMEGISSEAASLAGTMQLGRLVCLYDSNGISLEGPTRFAFTEDVAARFRAYGWHVAEVSDGNDLAAITEAITAARQDESAPHLIVVHTHLGYGSPRQDTKEAHGEPLGPEGTRQTKERLGWPTEPAFLVPEEAKAHMALAGGRGQAARAAWQATWEAYARRYPEQAEELQTAWARGLPSGWDSAFPTFTPAGGEVATRDASARVLQGLASRLPDLLGGSADLAPSTKTLLPNTGDLGVGGGTGRNIHFGVREHAMVAMANGMARHGGLRPYTSTFLIFSDYARGAIRLGALMQAPVLHLFTHDSIALGEDGPTHQPVEQLWALRAIPGLDVVRPADANETAAAWRRAISDRGPVAFALTRQKLPVLDPTAFPVAEGVAHGGYVLRDAPGGSPQVVLVGTGSEVGLCLGAQERLAAEGIGARVVSMPSTSWFDREPESYRTRVLPPDLPCVAVEAGATIGWWKYVGKRGRVVGLDRCGASAPGAQVLRELGFTVERVTEACRAVLGRHESEGRP